VILDTFQLYIFFQKSHENTNLCPGSDVEHSIGYWVMKRRTELGKLHTNRFFETFSPFSEI
jgi:hypothetical protein